MTDVRLTGSGKQARRTITYGDIGYAGEAQAQNRQKTAVAGTREKVTWNSGVREVGITVYLEDAEDTYTNLAVCFDAPNDATADVWLTAADSETADSNMVIIPAGSSRVFYFDGDGITRVDFIRLTGTDAMGVLMEAA